MYKIIYRFIRPNVNIDFLPFSETYKNLLSIEKIENRLLDESITLVENSLVQRHMLLWNDIESLKNFNKNEEIIKFNKRLIEHNKTENIKVNIIGEEYDE